MPEDKAEVKKVDLSLEQLKPLMNEGEVFITNGADQNSESWKMRIHTKEKRSAQQFAGELQGYINKGVGKWESVRVVNKAFDVEGKPVKGMVALVGVPKAQA